MFTTEQSSRLAPEFRVDTPNCDVADIRSFGSPFEGGDQKLGDRPSPPSPPSSQPVGDDGDDNCDYGDDGGPVSDDGPSDDGPSDDGPSDDGPADDVGA